jgi:hypothetical protein
MTTDPRSNEAMTRRGSAVLSGAWSGMAVHGRAWQGRQGGARLGRRCTAWQGTARLWPGAARHGLAGLGWARPARRCEAWFGRAQPGTAKHCWARLGEADKVEHRICRAWPSWRSSAWQAGIARDGSAGCVVARLGNARRGRLGSARLGAVGAARPGVAGRGSLCAVWRGTAGAVWRGGSRPVWAERGGAWPARHGTACPGRAKQSMARLSGFGQCLVRPTVRYFDSKARHGFVRLGEAGPAGLGTAWPGGTWPGKAWRDNRCPAGFKSPPGDGATTRQGAAGRGRARRGMAQLNRLGWRLAILSPSME